MPRPRQIVANQFYLLSRRCTQRLFLLRPDDATTNAFLYCLTRLLDRETVIRVLLTYGSIGTGNPRRASSALE